jgi:hypothetical protein
MLGVRPYLGSEAVKTLLLGDDAPRVLDVATPGFFLLREASDPAHEAFAEAS